MAQLLRLVYTELSCTEFIWEICNILFYLRITISLHNNRQKIVWGRIEACGPKIRSKLWKNTQVLHSDISAKNGAQIWWLSQWLWQSWKFHFIHSTGAATFRKSHYLGDTSVKPTLLPIESTVRSIPWLYIIKII